MIESDDAVVDTPPRGPQAVPSPLLPRGGRQYGVRLVMEEGNDDDAGERSPPLSPRDHNTDERPIGTPDRVVEEDSEHVSGTRQGAAVPTPDVSVTRRGERVGGSGLGSSVNRNPPLTPLLPVVAAAPAANAEAPNRAAEALQRELNRQRGRGGAGANGRGRGNGRNRGNRQRNNNGENDDNENSDASSGDENNNGPDSPANRGGSEAARPRPNRPKKNRLSNEQIITRPHIVLQSHCLPASTTAVVDPTAAVTQATNYYNRPYGSTHLNLDKPALRQAIMLDSDWKFPLCPGGFSVTSCCMTRCEIIRLWREFGSPDVEANSNEVLGKCCGLLGGDNLDGKRYRRPQPLNPLRNPTANNSNHFISSQIFIGADGGNDFAMTAEEMRQMDGGGGGAGVVTSGGPPATPAHQKDSSRRMLITMIVLDVLTLGIPCGPCYNGLGTAMFGCWNRWQVRRKYRIEGFGWQDCFVTCFFPGCALHQHRQEIEFNQILMSSFGTHEMM